MRRNGLTVSALFLCAMVSAVAVEQVRARQARNLSGEDSPGTVTGSRRNKGGAEGVGEYTDETVDMEFVAVPGGCFLMGDTSGEGGRDEKPVHEVCLDDFAMAQYPVTVDQFSEFVNATGYLTDAEKGGGCFTADEEGRWSWQFLANWKRPGFSQTGSHPVVCVSWTDATEFTSWLSRASSRSYRLPTEAEWEYAARGGGEGRNYWGDDIAETCRYANVSDLTARRTFGRWKIHGCDDGHTYTAPVGSYRANDFGLYDMMGNVWEWTADWYGKQYYAESPKHNPTGPPAGRRRVPRGGSWRSNPEHVRASLRVHPPPGQTAGVGFRLTTSVQQSQRRKEKENLPAAEAGLPDS